MYVCTWFTCLIQSKKRYLLEQSRIMQLHWNRAVAFRRVKGRGSTPPQVFLSKKIFKGSIINPFPEVALCASCLVLDLNSNFPQRNTIFCHILLNIGTTLRAEMYSRRQLPLWEKWWHGPVEYLGGKLRDALHILNIFKKQL